MKIVLSSSAFHTPSASNPTKTYISSKLDNKYITRNRNEKNISNKDDINSCVTPWKQNYSVHVISTNTHLTPLDDTIPVVSVELHTTNELPLAGKEYLCFQIYRRSSHATQCVKSMIVNKAIDYIFSIDTFEQQCVVIKDMLQSPRIEDYMNTIGIDQSLSNRSYFEHKCLNNIKIYIKMQVSVMTNKT